MSGSARQEHEADRGRAGMRIAAGAVLCLVAAGALLWWQEGEAVFVHLVTATLAWCF